MSNLKKILAMALVFVMAFTMASGALTYPSGGYLDGDAINQNTLDSIVYLANLGIMNGAPASVENPDTGAVTQGFKFMPEDTLTRAQFCRMIYSIETGKDNADLYKNSVRTGFTDVPSNEWFAGYVNYAWLMGWVSGKSATKFDPNGELKLSEAVTLVLAYLGYDKADLAKNWPSNAILYGSLKGLFENGVEQNAAVSAPVQRQWAAVLITNSLDCAYVAKNDAGKYVDVAGGTVKTLKLGTYKEISGTIVANNRFSIDSSAQKTDSANKFVVKSGADFISFSKEFDAVNGNIFTDTQAVSGSINLGDAFLGATVKILYRETAKGSVIMTYAVDSKVKTGAVAKSAITYDGTKVTLGSIVAAKDYAAADSLDNVVFLVNGVQSTGDALLGGSDDSAALKAYIDALPANTSFTFTSVDNALKTAIITTLTFGKVEAATLEDLPNATPGEFTKTLTAVKINGVEYRKADGKIANNANTLVKDDYAVFSVDAISGAITITEVAKTEGKVGYVVETGAAASRIISIAGVSLKQDSILAAGACNLIADASNGRHIFDADVSALAATNMFYYAHGGVTYFFAPVAPAANVTSSFYLQSIEKQVLGGGKYNYVLKGLEAGAAKTYTFANIADHSGLNALVSGKLYSLTLTAAGAFDSADDAGTYGMLGASATQYTYSSANNWLTAVDSGEIYLLAGASLYGYKDGAANSGTAFADGKAISFKATLIGGTVYRITEIYVEQ